MNPDLLETGLASAIVGVWFALLVWVIVKGCFDGQGK
jgi:hypothetical protein